MKKNIYYFVKGLNVINILIPVITLICVSIVSYKALTYKSKIDTYEEYFITIDSTLGLGIKQLGATLLTILVLQ